MKALDSLCVQMSIEKSVLNKSCSSGSKLYSSWGHLLCCSPWSPQFFWRPLWFLLETLFYRALALLLQWLVKLSHAGAGLDEHFGSYQAKALEATLDPVSIWFTLPSRQGASWIPFGWNKTEKCAAGACLMHSSCSWVLGPWASPTESSPAGYSLVSGAHHGALLPAPGPAEPHHWLGLALPSLQCKVLLGRIWLFYIRSGSRALWSLWMTSIDFNRLCGRP